MWYVIQVRTGTEEEMKLQCQKLVSEHVLESCFIPYYEEMKRYQGSWHTERKILFPGYIFAVSDDPERLFLGLKKVIGLTKLLGADGEIIPLTNEEITFLMDLGGRQMIVEISVGIIEHGKIKILEGPLMGYEKSIRKIDRHRRKAYLELEMFGRRVKAEAGLEIVRKV